MYMVMKNFSLLRGVRNCRKLNHSVITTKFVSPTHPLDRNKKFLVCHICSICNRSASSIVPFESGATVLCRSTAIQNALDHENVAITSEVTLF